MTWFSLRVKSTVNPSQDWVVFAVKLPADALSPGTKLRWRQHLEGVSGVAAGCVHATLPRPLCLPSRPTSDRTQAQADYFCRRTTSQVGA